MTIDEVYKIARRVSKTVTIQFYNQDDLVQECALIWWIKCRYEDNISYVKQKMKWHLISLWRRHRKVQMISMEEYQFPKTMSPEDEFIPRIDNERLMKVIKAMIACKFNVPDAATLCGYTYRQTLLTWKDAKLAIKKIYSTEGVI
jgi:hypothetical protein